MIRAWLLLLFALPAWGAPPAANEGDAGLGALGVSCDLPVGTPVVPATYDDAGVSAALTSAAAGTKVVRLDANFTPTSRIAIPDDVTVFSLVGAEVNSTSNTRGFEIGDRSRVTGLKLSGTRPIQLQTSTGVTGWIIDCNSFVSEFGVYDASTADNTGHTLGTIEWNSFVGHAYAGWFTRTNTTQVVDNYLASSTNRNFEFHGGSENRVLRNRIIGGITGVAWRADSQYGRFFASMGGNVVADNWLSGISEEAISFDINGDGGAEIGIIDQFTVEATTGTATSSPRINIPRTANFDSNACGNWSVTFSKASSATVQGLAFRVAACAVVDADTIYVQLSTTSVAGFPAVTQTQFSAITAGDLVEVGSQAQGNIVARNYCEDSFDCIKFWGMGLGSQIVSNILMTPSSGGLSIDLTSLCGLVASTRQVSANNTTTAVNCGIVDRNLVSNNVALGSIRTFGRSYTSQANTLALGATTTNQLVNNASAVLNSPWANTPNGDYGSAFNSAGQISNNDDPDAGAGFIGGTNPTTAEGFKLRPTSPLRRAGTCVYTTGCVPRDFGGRRARVPPDIGAWQRVIGD